MRKTLPQHNIVESLLYTCGCVLKIELLVTAACLCFRVVLNTW